ncbi:MAG: type II toxin-antitoxin system Phd/YefM family antitoxin [Parvularculaceae bacterium]|nr:type II toxin-antitoxin system Phd/YefM family antitoxin [Parvularculaceae bacterium]
MGKVSSSEFVRTPGHFQDQAQREPVIIMKHNREHAVILSADEYRRLKRRDRLVFRAGELSDADISAIRQAAAPAAASAFDDEMDER